MACRISELVINAADPDRLAAFWSEILGYVELDREDDGSIAIGLPPGKERNWCGSRWLRLADRVAVYCGPRPPIR